MSYLKLNSGLLTRKLTLQYLTIEWLVYCVSGGEIVNTLDVSSGKVFEKLKVIVDHFQIEDAIRLTAKITAKER